MKTTLHYLLAILLFSLTTVHTRAATADEGPFKITDVDRLSYTYNQDTSLLIIRGGGNLTITGDGSAVDCGIVFEGSSAVSLKIKNLHIRTDAPLLTKENIGGVIYTLELEGTNILEATAGSAIYNSNNNIFQIIGNGSLTLRGAENASAMVSTNGINKNGNNILIAIDGKGANSSTLVSNAGLFLHGKVNGTGHIEQVSCELKSDINIVADTEIPDWATVVIPNGQSITIPPNVTLTNKGTLTLENNSTLVNQGILSLDDNATFDPARGTFKNAGTLTIKGGKGLDIMNADSTVTVSYDNTNKRLILGGSGSVTILGKGNPVDCEIEIANNSILSLTMKDLHIKAPRPLTVGNYGNRKTSLIVQGTNILESDAADSQPGILLNGNLDISGQGSLRVKGSSSGGAGVKCTSYHLLVKDVVFQAEGGNTAPGMDCFGNLQPLTLNGNAFLIAVGGKGAGDGINQSTDNLNHVNGLLISGIVINGDTISQKYAELVGNMTVSTDAELPEWAEITVGNGQTFTIADGVTFTNKGHLYNHGTILSNRVKGNLPEHFVTFESNYRNAGSSIGDYIMHGSVPPDTVFTRTDYTFSGWHDASLGGTEVTVVTHPQTLYAYWTPNNLPPTVYYTVTLPEVEGATTDPIAGTHQVESGGIFSFYLKLDTAYSQSQPIVTTSRGETVTPRISNGAYIIRAIDTDMEIFIDGLEKNPVPVANETIYATREEPEIWTEHSSLYIRTADSAPVAPVRILTPSGLLLHTFRSTPGLNRRQLPTGMYIVQVGNWVQKVFVR